MAAARGRFRLQAFKSAALPIVASRAANDLRRRLDEEPRPRVAVVKQDVHDDLYVCAPGASAAEIVLSTYFRSGPVALFTKLAADFRIVRSEADPECRIWEQKWTECRWCPLEYFEAFRDHIPGRAYGNGAFAVDAASIDWSQYDLVISSDVSVPARVTKEYPRTVWCYYVREVKTSAYAGSLESPLPGQDLHLTQAFRPFVPRATRPHNVEFPYFLHYYGCFHELTGRPLGNERQGTFVEHLTDRALTPAERIVLAQAAPVLARGSSGAPEEPDVPMPLANHLEGLMSSKYFVKAGGRPVWGNSMVEAIAAGCLAIGDPTQHSCPFLFEEETSARSMEDVAARIRAFEADASLYRRVVRRQRALIDYLCCTRPLLELMRTAERVRSTRA